MRLLQLFLKLQLSFGLAWEIRFSLGHCLFGGSNNCSISHSVSLKPCKVFLYSSCDVEREKKVNTDVGVTNLGKLGNLALWSALPLPGELVPEGPRARTSSLEAENYSA